MLLRYLFTLIISTAVGVAGGFGLSSLDTQTWKATAEI
ncbi:putative transport protein [Actinobacillus pleuropneumoniae]|nr:putative transport protein [Actinobacillus pleuropneumoniae]